MKEVKEGSEGMKEVKKGRTKERKEGRKAVRNEGRK